MNKLFLILLCQFILAKEFGHFIFSLADSSDEDSDSESYLSAPTERLELQIESRNFPQIPDTSVKLIQKNTKLVNKNLPVWELELAEDVNDPMRLKLVRIENAMKEVGDFVTYHDASTYKSSAVVYFAKHRRFNGMIGLRYFLKELPISHLKSQSKTILRVKDRTVHERSDHDIRQAMLESGNEGDQPPVTEFQGTYELKVFDGIPKVLIIVGDDDANSPILESESPDWYTTIVENVITLFNGVHMLYSTLERPRISINIAGVIVAKASRSLVFMKRCYTKKMPKELDVNCVSNEIYQLTRAQKIIPEDSYDIIVYLSKSKLFRSNIDSHRPDNHESLISANFNYKPNHNMDRSKLITVVTNTRDFLNYVRIVREIGHMMSVQMDSSPYVYPEAGSCEKVLDNSGTSFGECLSWPTLHRQHFYRFYSSTKCCTFISSPRSILPPGRYDLVAADDQCRCHGYEYAKKHKTSDQNYCRSPLRCYANRKYYETPIPIEGTPCRSEHVCWDRKCEKIAIFGI